MKRFVIALAAMAVCGLLAVPAFAATRNVTVGDTFFRSKTVTVKRNTTVKWTWRGSLPHDVKVTSGPVRFKSTVKTKGSYSRKLTRKGTYRILCTIHPGVMRMTIKVT
jgi:plastocyanin